MWGRSAPRGRFRGAAAPQRRSAVGPATSTASRLLTGDAGISLWALDGHAAVDGPADNGRQDPQVCRAFSQRELTHSGTCHNKRVVASCAQDQAACQGHVAMDAVVCQVVRSVSLQAGARRQVRAAGGEAEGGRTPRPARPQQSLHEPPAAARARGACSGQVNRRHITHFFWTHLGLPPP